MKVSTSYQTKVSGAVRAITESGLSGADGHARTIGGELAYADGNTRGRFTLTGSGLTARTYGDLAAAIAAHMAWNTRVPVTIWHQTSDGRRKVLIP